MNVARLARAWFDHHDFSTFPPSGDGSYAPQRPLRLYSLNGIAVKQFVKPNHKKKTLDSLLAIERLFVWSIETG